MNSKKSIVFGALAITAIMLLFGLSSLLPSHQALAYHYRYHYHYHYGHYHGHGYIHAGRTVMTPHGIYHRGVTVHAY
jgi:hypothetical protein